MQIALPFDRLVAAVHPLPASPAFPAAPALPALPAPPGAPATMIFVRHPRARRYIIRVTDDGTVRVTIPRWGSKREAREFAEREQPWVERQRTRLVQTRVTVDEAEDVRELRARAKRELPPRLLQLAAQFGLRVSKVSVRNQKWRWGSCSPSGHICLNWRLVRMPDAVRDYVLVHELMHLKRMDHSPKFWKLVAQACPNYRELRQQLKRERWS